jgi:hypothetical protein
MRSISLYHFFQLLNRLRNFHETRYDYYAITGSHSHTTVSNSVTEAQTCEMGVTPVPQNFGS